MEYVLLLDLKDNTKLIAEYEHYHRNVWDSVKTHLKQNGILAMRIYRLETRLVMIIKTAADFSFEKLQEAAEKNPAIIEWENLMSQFQQPLPQTKSGEKWLLTELIFQLR